MPTCRRIVRRSDNHISRELKPTHLWVDLTSWRRPLLETIRCEGEPKHRAFGGPAQGACEACQSAEHFGMSLASLQS